MKPTFSRRTVLKGSAAAAAAVGLSRFTALSYGSIIGSNEDIRVGVIGFHGRGQSHIQAWRDMKGVRIVALCDADEKVLSKGYAMATESGRGKAAPSTRPSTQPSVASAKVDGDEPSKPEVKPAKIDKYTDLRHLLDDKNIDAISTATPNHWHALITVWGCQAGKDVYVEKPTCHDVWEGRKAVEAARKYNRIVQAGTQSRSDRALRQAMEWVHEGNIGKVKVARGFCYKRRGTIGKVEEVPQVPKEINLDLWCGPSPLGAPHRKQFHYDWHWFWETGNGDIGNQGIHQMDIARWGLGRKSLSSNILSVGGRFGYDDDGQTPNTQFAIHNYGDALLIFEVRGLPSKPGSPKMDAYKGQSVGHVIECEDGYLAGTTAYDNDGKAIITFHGDKGGGDIENRSEGDHFGNFMKAVRSRNVSDLHADIEQGFLSSALCHTSNISYRLGNQSDPNAIKDIVKADAASLDTFDRFKEHLAINNIDITMDKATLGMPLKMDPKTERFIDNEKANDMLTRTYRKPFVVPETV